MRNPCLALSLVGVLALAACQDNSAPTVDHPAAPSLAAKQKLPPLTGTPAQRASQIIARVNARLEGAGSTKRLDEAWFFSLGKGTDPFRRLRTGSRWTDPTHVTYMIDPIAPPMCRPTRSWPRSGPRRRVRRGQGHQPQPRRAALGRHQRRHPRRHDPDGQGNCVDIVDLTSPGSILRSGDRQHRLHPGRRQLLRRLVDPKYFRTAWARRHHRRDVDVLRRGRRVGRARTATATGSTPRCTTTTASSGPDGGSPFLSDIMDIQSIVTHEAGHAMGLGHFGGPNTNQPFNLKPNGRVFDPEAIMNPFYVGGDKRNLSPPTSPRCTPCTPASRSST